ncbi:MAG: NlpC/P60 family protein [Candidatus Xenobia bacterium]
MRTGLVFVLLAFMLGLAPAKAIPYVVQKGDTLHKIARRHHLSMAALRRANPQLHGDVLHPGDRLALPLRRHRMRAHVPMPTRVSGEPGEQPRHVLQPLLVVTPAPPYQDTALLVGHQVGASFPQPETARPMLVRHLRGSHDLMAARVIARARRQLGVPYVWGGTSWKGADCSGFVMRVYKRYGIPILRTADCQYYQGKPVQTPEPGDLVFFSTYLPGPSHVGIYLGHDRFIHASSRQKKVVISSLHDKFFRDHYIGARRFF